MKSTTSMYLGRITAAAVLILTASAALLVHGFVQLLPHQRASFVSSSISKLPQQTLRHNHHKNKYHHPLQMGSTVTIDQWSIASNGGITGIVKDSPNPRVFKNGESLTTSKITNGRNTLKEGITVTTASGSQYKLGSRRGKRVSASEKNKKTPGAAAIVGPNSEKSKSSANVNANANANTNTNTNTQATPMPMIRPRPPITKDASIPTLRKWTINDDGTIKGIVFNSPDTKLFKNGESITTSKIMVGRQWGKQDAIKEGDVVTTVTGSKYQLGIKKKTPLSFASSSLLGGNNSNSNNNNSNNKKEDTRTSTTIPIYTIKDEKPAQTSLASRIKNRGSSPFESLPKRDTKPAPFASRGRANTNTDTNTDSDSDDEAENETAIATTFYDKIPILDNWSLNRREELVGIISNSPYPRERDGRTVTTKEVATDAAFVVEGFTVVTFDGRKYKLGTPKRQPRQQVGEDVQEVVTWATPTLVDWDVVGDSSGDDGVKIEGIMQNTNDVKIPNGEVITTEEIMTSMEFLAEGFSVVSSNGSTYKLGRRDRTGVRRRQAMAKNDSSSSSSSSSSSGPAFQLPSVSVPEIKLPEVSAPKLPEIRTPSINSVFTTPPSSSTVTTEQASASVVMPTLENWTVGNLGRITGTISNSAEGVNGQMLTTGQSTTPAILFRPGVTVYAENGSAYKLGVKGTELTSSDESTLTGGRSSIFRRNKVNVALLDEWSMTGAGGVTGIISNSQDPNVEDGDTVTTSKIITEDVREGRAVETMNGSVYVLGTRRKEGVAETPLESPETPIAAGLWVVIGLLFVILSQGMY